MMNESDAEGAEDEVVENQYEEGAEDQDE